jgi:hypothetical protein
MSDLVVVGSCRHDTLHRSVRKASERGVARIDLSRTTWVTPLAIVAICTFAERAVRSRKAISFRGPANPNVAHYLDRMHLAQVLDSLNVKHDLAAVRHHDVGDSLLEARRFDNLTEMVKLAEHVHDALHPSDLKAAKAIYQCVSTAGENIYEHSGQTHGFFVAQRTFNGNLLRFAIGDSGKGFLRALESRGAMSDGHALTLAVTKGVSSVDGVGRGTGLSSLSKHLRSAGGGLILISGSARLNAVGQHVDNISTYRSSFKGSLIEGFVPLGN